MRRVEDVLGKGWENHVEGQKLKADGDSFRLKLNIQQLFNEWAEKVSCLIYLFIQTLATLYKTNMYINYTHNYMIMRYI